MGIFIEGKRHYEGGEEARGSMLSERVAIWNELMKLHVVAFHFYQGMMGQWLPEVGDMYCLTRCGLELFVISRMSNLTVEMAATDASVIEAKMLVSEQGLIPSDEAPPLKFGFKEFTEGGFSKNRLVIPQFVWMKANSDQYPLRQPIINSHSYRVWSKIELERELEKRKQPSECAGSSSMGDDERKAFDALAAADSIPQLGTPWPAGPQSSVEYGVKQIGSHAMKIEEPKEEDQPPGPLWLPGQ